MHNLTNSQKLGDRKNPRWFADLIEIMEKKWKSAKNETNKNKEGQFQNKAFESLFRIKKTELRYGKIPLMKIQELDLAISLEGGT